MPHIDYETLTSLKTETDETTQARNAILSARQKMQRRKGATSHLPSTNANLSARDIEETIVLSPDVRDLLKLSSAKLNLSPRSYHRLIKVARTIADIDDKENIEIAHVLEALQYRVPL